MSPTKRVVSLATSVLIFVLLFHRSLVPNLPPEVVNVLIVLMAVMAAILMRIVMNDQASFMQAERDASAEQRELLEAEIAASRLLARRLLLWGTTLLVIGLAGVFVQLVLASVETSLYPDVALPVTLTLVAVGFMSIVLGSAVKHRLIRFSPKKN